MRKWMRRTALLLAALMTLASFGAASAQETVDRRKQQLYEESVQAKYAAFLADGYHNMLMSDGLYACVQIHRDIQQNEAGSALVEWASNFIGEGLDKELWATYLAAQLTMQEEGFDEAAASLAEYDSLKSLAEYTSDATGVVMNALDLEDYADSTLAMLSDLLGVSSDLLGGTVDALEDYQNILRVARNYENHELVLSAIIEHTGNPELKEAAEYMLSVADRSLQMQTDALRGLAVTADAAVATNIIGGDVFDYLFSLPEYKDDPVMKKLVDGEFKFLKGFKLFNTIYDLTSFGGDMLLGTTDVFKRYSEIAAINELIAALSAKVEAGMVSADAGAAEILEWAEEYVPLMQAIALLRLRGEYCAVSMVYYDAQGASLLERIFGEFEEAIDFYNDRRQFLEICFRELNDLLIAPPDEAYRYEFNGRDVLWADLDGDGLTDALGCTQEKHDASVNIITSGHDKFSFVRQTMIPEGFVIGADLGDGGVTIVVTLATGGTAGSVHIGMYRPGDCEYVELKDVMKDQKFTGKVGSDGATATVTTPLGETFEGKMSISWDKLAGCEIMTDPIYYVEHVYIEEEECYDLVTLQCLWPEEMHNAAAGIGCTQYHLEDGEFVIVKQWVEFY